MSRVVVVTGASRGIGEAIVKTFSELGDTVIGISRSGNAVPGANEVLSVDVADRNAVTAAVKQIVDKHGAIDVLVANAGITSDGLALRMGADQWRDVLATNLDGAFFCAQAAMASMVKKRAGSIVFIGSVSPFLGIPGQANYSAAKAGLVGLARSLASELARRNITVNVVAPGLIETDMTKDLGASRETLLEKIPAGVIGQPRDGAGVVACLASPQARYITGAVVPVDGGLGMGL